MPKQEKKTTATEQVQERFIITCKKCGSNNVVIAYESEGGYSEYTQWGSSVTIGCNACKANDCYVESD